ncbi:STAS domain-containing protein [Nonomuraea sp. NPDC000554]|uniref:STAS domain-containing protein n=1 Tax=Nonomuraea sp. NPDC000554 TaxID=3154259 RepID=UPI00331B12CD
MDFGLHTKTVSHDVTIAVRGEVDIASEPELCACLTSVLARPGTSLVLDLGGVTFMDARGLSALVSARSLAERSSGTVCLANVPPAVIRLLKMTDLDSAFTMIVQR